jgi:hypothetical protein
MLDLHPHVLTVRGQWRNPPATEGDWGVRRAGNGALQVIWTCRVCGFRTSPVRHIDLPRMGVDIRDLPIVEDYAGTFARCIVRGCESGEVELNHFAPQAIFGTDADDWPTGYLCVRHHQEWGERVTPQLNRRRAS